MLERYERPVKIICAAMVALLVWQVGSVILRGNPLAHLTIPALPTLPGATNETNAADVKKTGPNGTNATISTNAAKGTNVANSTNVVKGTNAPKGTNVVSATNAVSGTNAAAKSTNAPAVSAAAQTNVSSGPRHGGLRNSGQPDGMSGLPPGMPPGMMARMMGGGMPGGPGGGGMKKIELPPELEARVARIIDSEIFGALMKPMPMALIGIAEQEAFIQATNGQTGPIKVGGEMGGVKLLRIGVNRVLVELGGEKSELTLFGGVGGESLMPAPTNEPSTNMASTNAPSTNAPSRRASIRNPASKPAAPN